MKITQLLATILLVAASLCLTALSATGQNIQDAIEVARGVVQADRQAVVAAAIPFTEDESKAFWPLYHQYRADMDEVGRRLSQLVLQYASLYPDVPADRAKSMLAELVRLEKKLVSTRASHLRKIGRVLPASATLRFAQVEARLDLALRLELAANIPLVPVAK